jgi:aryl-alcohol dehydrogenase-like predicted oxidoreductase
MLCYGTVGGGFLSDRWLGQPEPENLINRSLINYKLIIEDCGGWRFLQNLLNTLRLIATKHEVDIATIATAVALTYPSVAAAIVGATNSSHVSDNVAAARAVFDDEDRRMLHDASDSGSEVEGDVFDFERDRTGFHGRIMKYELNKT